MKLPLRTLSALISIAYGLTGIGPAVLSADQSTVAPVAPPSAPAVTGGSPVPPSKTQPMAPVAKGKPDAKGRKGKAEPAPDASSPAPDKDAPYVIGLLDVLQIDVWDNQKFSGTRDVRSDGKITMNLIGEINADGLTCPQLEDIIRAKLLTYMEEPRVTVSVLRQNSKKYYIFGGCGRSGEFPLLVPTRVLDAFANCNGFREFTDERKIYILRDNKPIPFNYKDVSHGKHMEQNIYLKNGDKIMVPQ